MRHCSFVLTLIFIAITTISCTGYNTFTAEDSAGLDSPETLKALIDSGVTKGEGEYRIVDVRPERKYQKGHIPTAINIPNGNLEESKETIPKDKKIIVYCETGGRAQAAAKNKLAPAGYDQIYNWGGFSGWTFEPEK